ncbi:MAG: hypothetical protein HXY19_00055 [Thermoanaerobaculaceae bacterium]|jgi:hypothetical protein|nr:hypothetical protein [Thermoanaerobaculaceae bacterium]
MQRANLAWVGAAAVGLVLASCSTAVPTGTKGVERVGAAVLRYRGPEVEAVLGYRFAAANLGEDCLILDLAMTGATGEAVEVHRSDISLLTPSGEAVALPTQEEFGREFRRLQPLIRRSTVAADPLDYWLGRMPCDLELFAAPGEGVAFDSVTVNDRRVCAGKLFFFVPGGTQRGTYTLVIALPESEVRLPFRLGE